MDATIVCARSPFERPPADVRNPDTSHLDLSVLLVRFAERGFSQAHWVTFPKSCRTATSGTWRILERWIQMKPKPFEIFLSPQPDREHWVYMMRVGDDENEYAEHTRRAVLMMHAPALLHELKAAFQLLLQVLDHHRDGKPLPPKLSVRRVALDSWNVIDLADGRKTEGTRFYPPPDNVARSAPD
jgi:hypothetical protein